MEHAKALASILKEHPTLKSLCGNSGEETELDMSGKGMDAGGAIMLVPEIVDNGALKSLNLAANNLGRLVLPEGWSGPDHGGEYRDPNGEYHQQAPAGSNAMIAIANGIKDMGGISSVNPLKNNIPVKHAQELVKIMQSKEKLVTLCGLSKEETELDFSGQRLDAGDAVLIANDISDIRALTSLNVSSNSFGSRWDNQMYKWVATPEGTTFRP
jgi:hypothetical protein